MPAPPVSKSQLDKLGDRLRDSGEADAADLDLLEEVLTGYHGALQVIIGRLRELGCDPTHRLKTTSTIIGKLRRDRSSSLKSVHDLAGTRVIVAGISICRTPRSAGSARRAQRPSVPRS